MNLFNKLYENVNPNKLVDELQAQGLLEQEKMAFFPKDNGLEIRFVDIKEFIEDTDEEGNIMDSEFYYTYYKKKNIKTVTEVNEETGEETPKEVIEWIDYTLEFEQVLVSIDSVIAVHEPIDRDALKMAIKEYRWEKQEWFTYDTHLQRFQSYDIVRMTDIAELLKSGSIPEVTWVFADETEKVITDYNYLINLKNAGYQNEQFVRGIEKQLLNDTTVTLDNYKEKFDALLGS